MLLPKCWARCIPLVWGLDSNTYLLLNVIHALLRCLDFLWSFCSSGKNSGTVAAVGRRRRQRRRPYSRRLGSSGLKCAEQHTKSLLAGCRALYLASCPSQLSDLLLRARRPTARFVSECLTL